jgi:hypothetical protein
VKSSPIDQYLSTLGTPQESESEFTVNALAALRKMSRFQLPDPTLWAVKMVQGAVAAGCFGVEFHFTRQEMRCSIYGAPIPNALDLLRSLLSGNSPTARDLHHWIVAIRSLFGREFTRWGWSSVIDGERDKVTIVDGEPISRTESCEAPVDSLRLEIELSPPRGPVPTVGHSEYKHLCDLCALCPIPVTVDGRLVSQQHPACLMTANFAAVWMEQAVAGPYFPLDTNREHPKNLKPFLIASKTLAKEKGVHPCSRIVMVGSPGRWQTGGADVYWIRDGALLGPISLQQSIPSVRLQIICPGDQLQMDLSEWGIRSPEQSFPAEEILRTVRELGDHLRPRKKKSVRLDYKTDFPWLSKLGELGLQIAEFMEFFGKSEGKVGLPEEFIDGIDSIAGSSSLSLSRH